MYKEYDFRMSEKEVDYTAELPEYWDKKILKHLKVRLQRLLECTETYYSQKEKILFAKKCGLMKDIAFEQGALLKIEVSEKMGMFIIEAPRFCFCDILKKDRALFEYLRSQTVFMKPIENGIQIEVIVSFVKRRKKNWLRRLLNKLALPN